MTLYDKYQNLMNGYDTSFNYNDYLFQFHQSGGVVMVSIEIEGKKVTAHDRTYRTNCMTDLQGMAACLLAEKRYLYFDKEGNFTK